MSRQENSIAVATVSQNETLPDIARQVSTQSTLSKKYPQTFRQQVLSWRAVMAAHMLCVMVLFVLLRLNMSIAIVCMLERPSNSSVEDQTMMSYANVSATSRRDSAWNNSTAEKTSQNTGEFQWESSIQGLILTSSNMLGFILPLMTDFLVRVVGGKRVLTIGLTGSAILTILQPIAARTSSYLLIALRMGVGLLNGCGMPLVTEVFSWWAPEHEKVSMVSFAFSGINIGNVLVGVTSAFMCSIPVDNGWPFIFYLQGAVTLLWCILWQLTGSISPEQHPFISEKEKDYIIQTRFAMNRHQKKAKPPYKEMLKSKPAWGFVIVMTCHMYATLVMFSYLPLFLTTVFRISVEEAGTFSSVGYIARFLGVLLWGQFSNLIFRKTKLGKTACRKITQCTGFYVCLVSLAVLGFMNEMIPALCVLAIAMLSQSATMASGIIMPLDMAPRYAGFLTGVFTSLGAIISIPGPIITSLMTAGGTLEEWRNVFILVAVVFGIGATSFLFLANSDLQTWAVPPDSNPEEEKKNPPASDEMMRHMTVLTLTPPLSPDSDQRSFHFNENREQRVSGAAYHVRGNPSPLPADRNSFHMSIFNGSNTTTAASEGIVNAKLSNADTTTSTNQSDFTHQLQNRATNSPSLTTTVKVDTHNETISGHDNLAFESAPEAVIGQEKVRNSDADVQGIPSGNSRRNPALKLNITKEEPAVFYVGGKSASSSATSDGITVKTEDWKDNVMNDGEESNEKKCNIVEQTRL